VNKRASVLPILPLVSGVLLYLFAAAWKICAALAVPLILALHETAPRLAMLSWLGLAVSPALLAALGHGSAHGVMDWFDKDRAKTVARAPRWVTSAWAGLLALFAMSFAAMTSVLVLLALFPVPPGNRIAALIALAEELPFRLSVHAAIWVAAATIVFWVERAARTQGDA